MRNKDIEIAAQGGKIDREVLRRFLERHEDARFVVIRRPAHEELHREQRLAAPGIASKERRPTLGQPAAGELIQSDDARGCLWQRGGALMGERGRVGSGNEYDASHVMRCPQRSA